MFGRTTVHYQGALDGLRTEGYPVRDESLAHLSPTRYAQVNPYGRHYFHLGEAGYGLAAEPGRGPCDPTSLLKQEEV